MTAARLLKRITGRSVDAASSEAPVLTHSADRASRPVPRTVEHWCLILSLILMTFMALWLAAAGSSVARAGARVADIALRAPTMEDYLSTLPGKPTIAGLETPALTATEIAGVNPGAAIERAFDSIRQFENARAEFRLGNLKPVISGVALASPAQQAGLQKGDELVSIWGKPAPTVWQFFVAVAANGAPSAEVEFKRGETTYRTSLLLHNGAPLDLNNIGLQIELPDGVRYLGPGDTRRLAEDFMRGYVEGVPAEWRKTYAASLDGLMRALGRRAEDQKARSPQDPVYLRSELILVWHHEAFMAEVERLRSQSSEAMAVLASSLAGLGRALAGLATTLLLALASFYFHSRSKERLRARR